MTKRDKRKGPRNPIARRKWQQQKTDRALTYRALSVLNSLPVSVRALRESSDDEIRMMTPMSCGPKTIKRLRELVEQGWTVERAMQRKLT